jgi:hypothetical protein
MHIYHGIYHNVYHGIYHGIFYDIYYGIYYGIHHAPVVYIMHLKRPTPMAHRMLLAFLIFHLEDCPVLSGIWTSRVPRAPQTAGAASHSLQPSSQSDVVACSTSMQQVTGWTSISLSHGSSTNGNLYRGKSGPAA